MSYSHPAAEYIKVLQQAHRRRLWKERAAWVALNLVLWLPMFTGLFK